MNLHENNLVSFGYNRVFNGYVLETLMFVMEYFDTYKWLSEEDKKKLISFSESSKIFYKEHYNYLSNKKANKYLSRMTEAVIKGEGMVV